MKMYLKLLISTILLFDIGIHSGKAEDDSGELGSEGLHMLHAFGKLPHFPKHHEFTEEEISVYTKEYKSGLQNEDIDLSGTELIQKYNYDVEEHYVITVDGYNLTMIRIPGKGRPVFLMHGLVSSYVDWLTAGPDKALAYQLADQGYDVWMGNARGNIYSNKHIRLSPSDDEFWDFSWHEIAIYDLPAMIDYVLDTTNRSSVTYVGHSQGTTCFFVLCSMKPEYNKKINFMVALSAVAWMSHIESPLLKSAAHFLPELKSLAKAFRINDILPENIYTSLQVIKRLFCGNALFASTICENISFLICGFDYSQINYKQLPVIFSHNPVDSSLKQFVHYGQLILSGYFRQFDYGAAQNYEKYGSCEPPSYAVDKITVPIAIFYSDSDWLSNTLDVKILRNKLQNVVDYHRVSVSTFNHVDYLYARDVKQIVYNRLLKLIKDAN